MEKVNIATIRKLSERTNLILILDHGGRAGSNFFQCLFDAHEQLVICPLVHYVYSYWQNIFGVKNKISLAEAHDFIANTSYFRFLYNDPVGEYKDFIRKIGGDDTAPFDRQRYRTLIDDLFAGKGHVSRRDVIVQAYGAYALCRGFDLDILKYIGINDAVSARKEEMRIGFSVSVVDLALNDFPKATILALTRDPRAQYASTRHQMVNEFGNNYDLHIGNWLATWGKLWRDELSLDHGPAHFCLVYQVAAFRALIKKWHEVTGHWLFLRNEDFNTNFAPTMTALSTELGINPDPDWLTKGDNYIASMMGRPWAGTGAYSSRYQKIENGPLLNDSSTDVTKMTGPNKYVTERWKARIPAHEQAILEILFSPEIKAFRYPFFISPNQKSYWQIVLKNLYPWSGEWPTLLWIKSSTNAVEFKERLFYLFTVWPLFALARYKLFCYASEDHFFEKDIADTEQYADLPFIRGAATLENNLAGKHSDVC